MCTVTFIPESTTGFILTSNRDEAPNRNTIPPEVYSIDEVSMLFPKDELAGGTWFGVSNRNRLICLLNGGFTAHKREKSYRKSRGVIVTDLLARENAVDKIANYDFKGVEPFTIVMVDWVEGSSLYEIVWDGVTVHFSEKSWVPCIWSSSLLYSEEIKKKRKSWFSEFIFNNLRPTETDVLKFHRTAGEGDLSSDVIMDRGFVKTKSITQYTKLDIGCMRYEDLQTQEITKLNF